MNDLFLICRLPSRSDPEKLYKAYRRIQISECSIANLPDSSEDGKNRFELKVKASNQEDNYILKCRKKDRKTVWWRCFVNNVKVPVVEPTENVTRIIANKKNFSTDLIEAAVENLLSKLSKELKEETDARIVAEQQNQALKDLVHNAKKTDAANLMDDSAMNEFQARIESLSTLVDKLTSENITLTNQVKSKKAELISLRKANGKTIDDLIAEVDDDDSSEESE